MDRGAWQATVHGVTESDTTERLNTAQHIRGIVVKNLPSMQEDILEKEMATHSGILAWEIPWTEKPGRLQSTGSQKSQNKKVNKFLKSSSTLIVLAEAESH